MTHEASGKFPDYPLLPQSTCLVFLEDDPSFTPASGYQEYCRQRQEARLAQPLFYVSTTITSGGFRRDETTAVGDAIQANSAFARALTEEGLVQRGIDPAWIVLPSELGKVNGWKQTDYLQFWLYVIRAVEPEAASVLESDWFRNPDSPLPAIGDNMETAPSYDERRAAYKTFVSQYLQMRSQPATRELLKPRWQPPVVIPGLDNGMSLGCAAEYYFADKLLPSWTLTPPSNDLRRTVASALGWGAMVAGHTQEQSDEQQAAVAAQWASYYDAASDNPA